MSKKVYLTRRETFAAAHRLFKPELSDEQNFEMFGKCSNPNWHGHNYTLEVTVAGEVNPETGFVLDITKTKPLGIPNERGYALIADDSKYTRKMIQEILKEKN